MFGNGVEISVETQQLQVSDKHNHIHLSVNGQAMVYVLCFLFTAHGPSTDEWVQIQWSTIYL